MTSWTELAKARFSQKPREGTDETSETILSSVLTVHPDGFPEITHEVSSVLAVGVPDISEKLPDLLPSEWGVLNDLEHLGPLDARTLAAVRLLPMALINGAIRSLSRGGLIVRRGASLQLSSRYRALLAREVQP